MTSDGIYKRYISGIAPPEGYEGNVCWFIFNSGKLLVEVTGDGILLPAAASLEKLGLKAIRSIYLGILEGRPCYSVEVDSHVETPGNMEYRDLRSLFGLVDEDIFLLAGRSSHLLNWDRTHRFCGRCGSKTEDKGDERAKICADCGSVTYPRISPAIIVAIVRDGHLLLAHAKHFSKDFYSVIAGFVEPGETFEECAERELMEEVGIKVKNLKYFGSQPWPFPDSLMVAFTAEYESGEISVDGIEISDAGWYGKDELPQTPSRMSIGGRLISWFKENY